MGLSDRDYMRDRDSGVFRPTESSAIHWIWIVPLCVVVLLVTLGPPAWLPAKAIAAVQGVQRQLGFAVARSAEELQSGPGSGQVDQPIGATAIGAQQSLPTRQVVRRCLVNGVAVDVLNSECPPAVATTLPQSPMPVARQPEAPSNPFVKPGTIYRCKNYSGGMFWSEAHCRQHNAVIDRIASVPVGIPFQQQVDIAAAEAQTIESTLQREQAKGQQEAICIALRNERAAIWKRSGAGSGYTPLQQVDADQVRWRQIKAQMASNNCGA